MIWLARRLVFHNRVRLAVTVAGVVFSAFLTLTQSALYIGMMQNATAIVRHAGADLWVASRGIQNFDFPKPFPGDRAERLSGRDEIAWARPILLSWGFLKLADGAQEQVEIIGYDPAAPTGGPWEMASGRAGDVGGGARIILDDSATQRLGALRVGDRWELNDRAVTLAGVSRAAKTFTTAPVVFTSLDLAHGIAADTPRGDGASYIAIKLRRPAEAERVRERLRRDLPDNEVLTTDDFVRRTVLYWTLQTGMGAALCLTAVLGLLVGAGVVGQTVFANTMEHLGEFATLKAMGAADSDLTTLILGQAAINTLAGFAIALALALASKAPLETTGVTLAVDARLVGALLTLTLAVAAGAAWFSLRKVRRLDPATIFRS